MGAMEARLRGKRNICKYMQMGWGTILKLKDRRNFPLGRNGNVWVSDIDEIKKWQVKQLQRR